MSELSRRSLLAMIAAVPLARPLMAPSPEFAAHGFFTRAEVIEREALSVDFIRAMREAVRVHEATLRDIFKNSIGRPPPPMA